jgi:F-type H+-transporting ATPase subunit delta
LTRHLGEVYGQQISLKVQVDPTVVGGAVIEVGDDRYDGSVARLLEQAKTALAS